MMFELKAVTVGDVNINVGNQLQLETLTVGEYYLLLFRFDVPSAMYIHIKDVADDEDAISKFMYICPWITEEYIEYFDVCTTSLVQITNNDSSGLEYIDIHGVRSSELFERLEKASVPYNINYIDNITSTLSFNGYSYSLVRNIDVTRLEVGKFYMFFIDADSKHQLSVQILDNCTDDVGLLALMNIGAYVLSNSDTPFVASTGFKVIERTNASIICKTFINEEVDEFIKTHKLRECNAEIYTDKL